MTRTTGSRRPLAAGTALAAGLALLAGCTAGPDDGRHGVTGPLRLVSFDSCAQATADLKSAAMRAVGPWGFDNGTAGDAVAMSREGVGTAGRAVAPAAGAAGVDAAPDAAGAGAKTGYSGTNTHETGVDEPDLVKTDGRRIVTVGQGVLRVVDPVQRRIVGRLDLAGGGNGARPWAESTLLLHGDHALVLLRDPVGLRPGIAVPDGPVVDKDWPGTSPYQPNRQRLLLVDLTGTPKLISEYRVDGSVVDARQVGRTARIVLRSAPRLEFSADPNRTDVQRIAANRALIEGADLADLLPGYEVTTGGRTTSGMVPCSRVSRPTAYSGASMLTVLTFDLSQTALTDGDPVTIVADGGTVYSNGASLYVADDQRFALASTGSLGKRPATQIYRFDTSRPGRPRYAASTQVPGLLLNQYAMSEWDGHLRVATTTGDAWSGGAARTSSSVHVLRVDGGSLRETGRVTGLGAGERIYSVRFDGGTGYVVTFRQTDPLYTLDLRDPAKPAVTGELKITGYSSYLHPLDAGRLVGIGQEASVEGRVQGMQVSLFDVADPRRPRRIDQYHLPQGYSEAESDPHAFLYWPADRLLVVPVDGYGGYGGSGTGVVCLRVGDGGLAQLGMISQPGTGGDYPGSPPIRRSLMVGGLLWTVSDAGLMASAPATMGTVAWLPAG